MATKAIAEDFHFSMSIGKGLFTELISAALPMKLIGGEFTLADALRDGARQLQVKQRVAGLLEAPENTALLKVRDKARETWGARRGQVYELMDRLVQVDGDWEVQLDREGSEFHYGHQEIGAEAYFKLVSTGQIRLLQSQVELPFTIERRLGAEIGLGDVRYDQGKQAIVGDIKNVGVDFGDHLFFKLLNDVVYKVIEQQLGRFNPVTVLPKAQLDELVGGAGTALKLKMEVTDVVLHIGEEQMTLKVKFGFTQLQLDG